MKRWWAAIGAALWLAASGAAAHKSSDAYLQLSADAQGLSVRWDIALRDLDAAVDLDADEDGRLSWGEIRQAWPRIDAYALPALRIDGCPLQLRSHALERRSDGVYAVLQLGSPCVLREVPAISYSLLREVDPTHRGIARIRVGTQADVLKLLDPQAEPAASGVAGSSGGVSAAPVRGQFLREGIRHILTGYDHVLFLLCLLLPAVMRRDAQGRWLPVARLRQAMLPIFGMVTAFTLAHSITLGLAASGLVSLSPAFIEPAIAATIVLAALDNVWRIFPLPRAAVAFAFGLIHGFGFAGALTELSLPTAQFAWALLEFNVGLEAGQLMIVLAATGLLFGLRRWNDYRRWVIGGGSWAAAGIGGLWLIERTANVSWLPF